MRKSLIGLTAAAGIAFAGLAAPSSANAGCYGCGVGAGLLGGLIAGTIIGNAVANNPPPPPPGYYGPPPPPPGYYPPPPPAYASAVPPGCHLERHRVWVDGLGYRIRRIPICP